MNNRLLRRVAVLLVAPFVPAVACGGRTGDLDLYGADSGAARGSGGAPGGKLGPAGAVAVPPATGKPPATKPPVLGSGGTIGKTPPPPSGGKATFGGSAGAVAAGGAPPMGCGPPFCNCGDCVANCACMLGGQTQYCIDQCSGNVGAGGAAQVICAGPPGQGARVCPSMSTLPFPSCCTASRECGLELLAGPGPMMSYPFATGCQGLNQPGRPEPGCPDLATLFNQGAGGGVSGPGGVPACCRPDGTCGIDASQVSLGCVQSLIGGRPIECPQSDAGAAGHPPIDAAIVD